jgi:hypothetical protein
VIHGQLRHPSSELWIRSTDSVVLNRKVSARERHRVNEVQHGAVDHRPHRLHVVKSKSGVDSTKGFFLMHDAYGGIVSLDDKPNLGLRNQHGVCVVQHRIHWVRGASVVATPITAETDPVAERDSAPVSAPVIGYRISPERLPLD